MRLLIQLCKEGPAKYISHLDLQRAMQRAIRRAGLPVSYSQGFHPHMNISYATALSLGIESRCELLDIKLERERKPDAVMRELNAALPGGLSVSGCREIPENAPSVTSLLMRAGYELRIEGDFTDKIRAFAESESVLVKKQGKKGMRDVDIRPLVHEIGSGADGAVSMLLEHSPSASLNPELLLGAMGIDAPYSIIRSGLFAVRDGIPINIWDGEAI